MIRRVHSTLLIALLVASSQGCPYGTGAGKAGVRTKASVAPAIKRSPDVPGVKLSGAPEPASNFLLAPKTAATRLSGHIALDSAYAVAVGAAVLANNGGNLIANNAGNLISDKGSGLIGNNSGNLIGSEPSGILSTHAAGLTGKVKLVSDAGGGLISDRGGSLISDKGSGLISNNSGNYALLAAGDAPSRNVPVAGMQVGVYSLRLGGLLPLGVDSRGKTVYSVFTDAKGDFTVHVPEAEKENVMVVASVPGTRDPRLAVDLVASARADGSLVVDDSSTVITGYLQRAIVGRLEQAVATDPCLPPPTDNSHTDNLAVALDLYADSFKGAAYQALPLAAKRRVIQRFADVGLAGADLAGVLVDARVSLGPKSGHPALPVIKQMLADVEVAAASRLRESATYFDDKPYVRVSSLQRSTSSPVSIRRGSDVSELIVTEFLTTNDSRVQRFIEGVFLDLGIDPARFQDMLDAGASMFLALAMQLADDTQGEQFRKAIAEAIADETAAKDPAALATPCGVIPKPPVLTTTVSTLAGTGTAGDANGAGASAEFSSPSRLLLDPRGFLVVSELDGCRIRSIDLRDPAHPVRTMAGTGKSGFLDGPVAQAMFNRPAGMAFGPDQSLYIADSDNNRIRKITRYAAADAEVSTVAGDGTAAFKDATGTAAQFWFPQDLTFGPDGSLYVADSDNFRIRRITAEGVVSTLAGADLDLEARSQSGIGAAAHFDKPKGLLLAPWGDLMVADTDNNVLCSLTLKGAGTVFAGLRNEAVRDGTYYSGAFNHPHGIAFDGGGDLWVADTLGHRIRLVTKTGWIVTAAGGGMTGDKAGGFLDGLGSEARFNKPQGVVVADDGTVYVADTNNHRIRMFKPERR